ncbi:MAG: AMP-binding protein [Synergistaceae bacterium]|jgi:long-chain acyl-CoA synthetase|nr:AMP-binding protein [Synergistaceae bacterium]
MSERLETLIDSRLAKDSGAHCFWWDGQWYDKADFARLTDRCADSLRASGFGKGQRLCLLMPNCPMVTALSLAVWRLGGTISPLNVKSGIPSLLGTLALIEPFAVIASSEIRDEAGAVLQEKGFVCATCGPMGPLPELEGKKSSIEAPDVAVIFATSGTTGLPKAVPLSHGNIIDNCTKIFKALRALEEGDTMLCVLPNFHSFGYTVSMILPLTIDASTVIVPGFLPPTQTVRAIRESGANILLAVPTIFSYLLAAMERGSVPKDLFASAKIMIAGGDRLGANMHETALRVSGKDIVEGYGLTETTPVIAVNRSYEEHRPGTVGPFLEGYEWHLRTEKGEKIEGSEMAPNGEGVLWVRGPSVTGGYFRAPELTAERFDNGWFNTGDYVRLEDGYIRILDRVTDIIIVGGFNVYPQEVELVLHAHPAVQTAIVVGMPHPVNGEVPKAFIRKTEGAQVTELEIVKYCKEQLAHFKVPRKVEFVDNFPLSGTGKILRRVLREQERSKG